MVQTRDVIGGKVEFCDFGFGDHSVRVRTSDSECAATRIENIRAEYGVTQKFSVIQNTCVREGDNVSNGCFTYVRVVSADDLPLKGVLITAPSRWSSSMTDSYGRAEVAVHVGSANDFTFSMPGFKSKTLHLACPSVGAGQRESLVRLPPISK